jgi:UDP-3-O-[3-hydroxymyristoyl] glucosamine N-acyltransferase
MRVGVSEIANRLADQGLSVKRLGPDTAVTGVSPAEHVESGHLVFADRAELADKALTGKPACVVTTVEIAPRLADRPEIALLITSNVKLAQALVTQAYADIPPPGAEWPLVHPSAIIHESAVLAEGVRVGPYAVIGRNVRVGRNSIVATHAVIEQEAVIGAGCVLHAHVYLGWGCRLGERVVIKPGAVIGAEGFGFAQDEQHRHHRIPQRGIVNIEDDVTISANCTVDRATFGETRIGRGSKFDTHCHVAHNVSFGEDCVVVAQSGISGSCRIGNRVLMSGQTGTIDHLNIADDVVLVHRAGLTKDITKPGMYAGTPTQPYAEYARNITVFRRLFELKRRVAALERQLTGPVGDGTKGV